MAPFFNKLKERFRTGSLLLQLIWINVGVLLSVRFVALLLTLFNVDYTPLLQTLQLPSNPLTLLMRPWTLVTYMFLQFDLLHLLFNMLWLYWFGKLFLSFFTPKQLGALYLLGGWGGALLYLLAYNLLPFFEAARSASFLMGASASVIAVVTATAFYAPNLRVRLLFLGEIPLKYIALATIALDAVSITSANAGGHIAHLGGALLGFLFVRLLGNGWDITRPLSRGLDVLASAGKKRAPRMKTRTGYRRPESDVEYNRRKATEHEEIGRILDKIKKDGYEKLTAAEKKRLFDAGNRS